MLFGDGPIGIKLGENPLKASGVCKVYVTEVRTWGEPRGGGQRVSPDAIFLGSAGPREAVLGGTDVQICDCGRGALKAVALASRAWRPTQGLSGERVRIFTARSVSTYFLLVHHASRVHQR